MRLSRQHVTLAVRSFARHPGFTITAILSLALAIALNTTMYSVLDALVNPDIFARDQSRLYRLLVYGDPRHRVGDAARIAMLREMAAVTSGMTYVAGGPAAMGAEYGNRYAQVSSNTVAPNYFDVLGIGPTRGRSFTAADMASEMPPIIINAKLAATLSPDRDFPIGARVEIDGVARPVIGIVAHGADVFVLPPPQPIDAIPVNLVRLRDDITLPDAERFLDRISTRFRTAAQGDGSTGFLLRPAAEGQLHLANFHFALIAAVAAVLLIACANLANLQLARGIARSRELALRAALGASRRDIVAQLLLESGVLAVMGLVAGLLFTFWGIHFVSARIPASVAEYIVAPQVSWRLVAFAMAACVACTLLIGLYPALRVSRVDPNDLLKSGAGTGANRKHRRQYGVMVALEVGLALALLSGAAIVVRTALIVREMRLNFDPKPLSQVLIALRSPRDTAFSRAGYAAGVLASIRAMPDVADAALYEYRTVGHSAITTEQRGGPPLQLYAPGVGYRVVSPSYLRTYRLPIIKGRDFLASPPSEPEIIVDRRFAARMWPGVDPVGLRVKLDDYESREPWGRIVGVVAEQTSNVEQVQSRMMNTTFVSAGDMFVVAPMADTVSLRANRATTVSVVVRARTDPARMPVSLRRTIPKSNLVWFLRTSSIEESLGIVRTRQSHDFIASLFMLFAVLAVGLAALGIYGIVSHSVNERKRELGVRLALGATSRDIVHAVIRDGNPMVLSGVAIGLYLVKKTVLWLHGFSIEGDEYDAALFAAVAATLFLVSLASALGPAWRATRIDPVESLRCE